jgi:hypothetical protein
VLVPPLDPGVALGTLLALVGSGRIGGQDRAADSGAQLPGGLVRGVGQHLSLDGGGVLAAEAADFLGDDRRLVAVDPPVGQRRHRGGQAAQREREIQQNVRGPPGQRQGGGDLIANVLPRHAVPGRGRLGLPARGQVGHRRQFQRRRPRGQPPGGPQYPDELIVTEAVQAGGPGITGETGQHRPGRQLVGRAASGESATLARLATGRAFGGGQVFIQQL